MTFQIKRGDTRPPLRDTLPDEDGAPLPLTGATVLFIASQVHASTPTIRGAVTGWDGAALADDGQVEYLWQPGDTDVAGSYRYEFQVTFADGGVRTVPRVGFFTLIIGGDLDT